MLRALFSTKNPQEQIAMAQRHIPADGGVSLRRGAQGCTIRKRISVWNLERTRALQNVVALTANLVGSVGPLSGPLLTERWVRNRDPLLPIPTSIRLDSNRTRR